MNVDISKLPALHNIKSISSIAAKYDKLFSVVWKLNLFCNYNCSYCFPQDRSDIKDFFSEETYLAAVDQIKTEARLSGFDTFHFSFVGGEPTQNPHFLKTLEAVCAKNDNERVSVNLTTNLSKPLSWWTQFAEITKPANNVIVTASFHIDYMRGKENDFANKLRYLLKEGINAQINIVVAQHYFDDYIAAINKFKEMGLQVQIISQLQTNFAPYTDEQIAIMRSHEKRALNEITRASRPGDNDNPIKHTIPVNGKRYAIEIVDVNNDTHYVEFADKLVTLGLHQYHGINCAAGFQSIYIQSNGNVQRGVADCRKEILGNITTGFKLNTSLTPCQHQSCGGGDLRVYKERTNDIIPINPV